MSFIDKDMLVEQIKERYLSRSKEGVYTGVPLSEQEVDKFIEGIFEYLLRTFGDVSLRPLRIPKLGTWKTKDKMAIGLLSRLYKSYYAAYKNHNDESMRLYGFQLYKLANSLLLAKGKLRKTKGNCSAIVRFFDYHPDIFTLLDNKPQTKRAMVGLRDKCRRHLLKGDR